MNESSEKTIKEKPVPDSEARRIEALAQYESPDSEPDREEAFDRLAKLASQICDVPIAFINLIGRENEYKKACYGFVGETTPRSVSFCDHAIRQNDVFEVSDAVNDPLFKENPNVTGSLGLRFYAGVPLTTQDGFNIGTLCLIGHQPGSLSESQKEALRILSDEIISRYELKSLKEKMEKRNAEKDELIRIVSHDMRNPLTGIIGFSELMQQETGNDEHREMLEYIETAGESMLNIVNVLLNSEYIRNEAFIINKREANASELTQNVIDLHKPFALMKNLDMDVQMEEDIICNLDAEKWKQIVGNLLNNAIKFSHPDDQIKLSLTTFIKRKPFLLLKITDKGIGISDEMIQNLFSGKDSIRREGTNGEESTGLGMYIVKKYVSLMGGTISISSTQGSGTQVTVQIPV